MIDHHNHIHLSMHAPSITPEPTEQREEDHDNVPDTLLRAVRPIPVAHQRAALAPHQPWRPERQQIQPPARPVAVMSRLVLVDLPHPQ